MDFVFSWFCTLSFILFWHSLLAFDVRLCPIVEFVYLFWALVLVTWWL